MHSHLVPWWVVPAAGGWSIVSLFYAAVIAQRIASGEMPGLATGAGVGAVLAVWVYLYDLFRTDSVGIRRRRLLLSAILAGVAVLNLVLVLRAVRSDAGFPLGRVLLVLLLSALVLHIQNDSKPL